ncbi:MAG: hypothetical protein AAF703_16810 [Cyanobacteria bacterium P01_D01_bin.105]
MTTDPLEPQDLTEALKELAAGYVLGDLSSEEAERFHQLMLKSAALNAEVESLQQALEMMPYALPEQRPKVELRDITLNAIQAEVDTEAKRIQAASSDFKVVSAPGAPGHFPHAAFQPLTVQQVFRKRFAWLLSGMAIGCAAALGAVALRPMRFASASRDPVAIQSTNLQTSQIEQVWQGFRDLSQDHNDSLREANGPADFPAQQASDVLAKAPDFQTTLAALPVLPKEKGELLGGSKCKFGKTAGLRLSYRVGTLTDDSLRKDFHIVSAYQLELNGDQFPQFLDSYITLRQADGTSIVLWREEPYLYALVADLPPVELNALAQEISHI